MKNEIVANDVGIKAHDGKREDMSISSILTEQNQKSVNSDNILMETEMVVKKQRKKKKKHKSSHGDEKIFEGENHLNFIQKKTIRGNEVKNYVAKQEKKLHKISHRDEATFEEGADLNLIKEGTINDDEVANHVEKKKQRKKHKRIHGDEATFEEGSHLSLIKEEKINDDEVAHHVEKKNKRKKHKSSHGDEATFGEGAHLILIKEDKINDDEVAHHVEKKKKRKKHKSSQGDEAMFKDGVNLNFMNEETINDDEVAHLIKKKKKRKKHKSIHGDEAAFTNGTNLSCIKEEKVSDGEIAHIFGKEKKRKKHKRNHVDEATFEEGAHLNFLKEEKINDGEVAHLVEKKKKKKKHKSSHGNEAPFRDGVDLNFVTEEKISDDKITNYSQKKKKKKYKSSHGDGRAAEGAFKLNFIEKEKIYSDDIANHVEKKKKKHKSSLVDDVVINSVPGGYIGDTRQSNSATIMSEINEVVAEKKGMRNKKLTMTGRSNCVTNGREGDGVSLLQTTRLTDNIMKKSKENESASTEADKNSCEISTRKVLNNDELMVMHTAPKKNYASITKQGKKRKHCESDGSISLEAEDTESGETMKKKKLNHINMHMGGVQDCQNSYHSTKKKMKEVKEKLYDARQTDVGFDCKITENKGVHSHVVSDRAKNRYIICPSLHKTDSTASQKKGQVHRKRVEDSKEHMIKENDSTVVAIEEPSNELEDQMICDVNDSSSPDASEQEMQSHDAQVVEICKDSRIISKNKNKLVEENYNETRPSKVSDDLPEGRRSSADYNSMKCEERITPIGVDNFHSSGHKTSVKMNGFNMGDNDKHQKKGNEILSDTVKFSDPVLLRKPEKLKARNQTSEDRHYHLKWCLTAEDKEELKRQGIEFEQGRWREEEIKKLEDNYQSVMMQTGLSSEDLIKLIKDKSSEAKRKRMDLGIYHTLLEGLNRPIRLVHQKLKKIIDPTHFKGKWLKSEEEILLQLFKRHGHDWARISQFMDRSRDSIIHKIQRLLCGPLSQSAPRVQNRKKWASDELERLTNAIDKIAQYGTGSRNERKKVDPKQISPKHIDWNSVSSVVRTRSAESCRFKWVFDLSLRGPGAERKSWTREQNLAFLEALSKCGKENEMDVDWAQILKDLELPGTVLVAKRKWRTYKFTVPHYKQLSFEQQLKWLTLNFIKKMREKRQYTEVVYER